MLRQLDQRQSDGLTVTLEWDATTGQVWVRCEDWRSPEESFSYLVGPDRARLAFLHPFAMRPSSQELQRSPSSPVNSQRTDTNRRRRWRDQRPATEADGPGDYTWIWWLP